MTTPGADPRGPVTGPVSPAGTSSGTPATGSLTSGWTGRPAVGADRREGRREDRRDERPDDQRAHADRTDPTDRPDRPAFAGRPEVDPAATPPRGVQAPARPDAVTSRTAAATGVPTGGGSGRPAAAATATVTPQRVTRPRRPGARRARLRLTRIDPWSALKTSLVFSGFLFIVWMVAVLVLFLVLVGAGTFGAINDFLGSVFGSKVDFNGGVILGGAAVIGALSVVLVSALGTVLAFAYNVTASLMGGIDVTYTESEG